MKKGVVYLLLLFWLGSSTQPVIHVINTLQQLQWEVLHKTGLNQTHGRIDILTALADMAAHQKETTNESPAQVPFFLISLPADTHTVAYSSFGKNVLSYLSFNTKDYPVVLFGVSVPPPKSEQFV